MKRKFKRTLIISLIFIFLLAFFCVYFQTKSVVKIIYFRNPRCRLIHNTDKIISELNKTFGKRIEIETYNIKLYKTDPPDPPNVIVLRKKYNVNGVPTIIIDGKEYTGPFDKRDLFNAVCNKFILKPVVCK